MPGTVTPLVSKTDEILTSWKLQCSGESVMGERDIRHLSII